MVIEEVSRSPKKSRELWRKAFLFFFVSVQKFPQFQLIPRKTKSWLPWPVRLYFHVLVYTYSKSQGHTTSSPTWRNAKRVIIDYEMEIFRWKQVERLVARSSTGKKGSFLFSWRIFPDCVVFSRRCRRTKRKWWDFASKVKSHSLPSSSSMCLSPPTGPSRAGRAQQQLSPLYKGTPDFSAFTNRHFKPVRVDYVSRSPLSPLRQAQNSPVSLPTSLDFLKKPIFYPSTLRVDLSVSSFQKFVSIRLKSCLRWLASSSP